MPRRTRCPQCQTVLNVPEGAEGKRLKCPRCATKFRVGEAGASPSASMPGVDTARPASVSMEGIQARDEQDMPVVSGELREQFDLPLLNEDDTPAARPKPTAEEPAPGPSSSRYEHADAAGLLEDDEPAKSRYVSPASARYTDRRCTCGAVVPAGMSLCDRCGLDLETGIRTTDFDDMDVEPAAPPTPPTPMGVLFVGVGSALVGLILALAAVGLYLGRPDASYRWGYLLLAIVSGFGIYAAVRLIRRRSTHLLQTALVLGGVIDLVAMVILPVVLASMVAPEAPEPSPDGPSPAIDPNDPWAVPEGEDGGYGPRIVPVTERIRWDQVYTGLAILAVTAIVTVYLNSAQVRRYTERRRY